MKTLEDQGKGNQQQYNQMLKMMFQQRWGPEIMSQGFYLSTILYEEIF